MDKLILIHKVETGQASEEEQLAFDSLREGDREFNALSNDFDLIMGASELPELPFEMDVDAAFNRFQDATKTIPGKAIDDSPLTIRESVTKPKTVKLFQLNNILKMAAMFVVLVVATFMFNQNKMAFEYENEIGVMNYTLDDNSSIILNKNSKISANKDFNKVERRVNFESGEVYFKIATDKSKPFIVDMQGVDVLVTGTAFNIKNDINIVEISVEEGSVSVYNDNRTFNLKINDKLTFNRESGVFIQSTVLSKNVFSWTKNELSFEGIALKTVFDDISNYYDVLIKYPKELNATNCKYTSPIMKNVTIDKVLEEIRLSYGLEVKKVNNVEFIISNINCE